MHEAAPSCHSEKYQIQQNSRHARTFNRISEHPDLELPRTVFPDPVNSKVTHTLRRVGGHLTQETRTPEHLYQAVLDYAFGSGDRGKTMIGHDTTGHNFELRLSVYHEKTMQATWGVTSGHAPHPASDQSFLGMLLTNDEVRRCFSCHVTSPQALLEASAPERADPAIGCEKCHGPGGNHLLAVAAKFPDLAIARPSLASGARVVKICAQCHSPRGKVVKPDDPLSIRFQGATLTWSRCYTESKDKLDCVTCHDPHRNAITEAAHYETKCLVCHPGAEPSGEARSKNHLRRFDLTEVPSAPNLPHQPDQGLHLLSHAQGQRRGAALHLHRSFHPGPPRRNPGKQQVIMAREFSQARIYPRQCSGKIWPLSGASATIKAQGQGRERRSWIQ